MRRPKDGGSLRPFFQRRASQHGYPRAYDHGWCGIRIFEFLSYESMRWRLCNGRLAFATTAACISVIIMASTRHCLTVLVHAPGNTFYLYEKSVEPWISGEYMGVTLVQTRPNYIRLWYAASTSTGTVYRILEAFHLGAGRRVRSLVHSNIVQSPRDYLYDTIQVC